MVDRDGRNEAIGEDNTIGRYEYGHQDGVRQKSDVPVIHFLCDRGGTIKEMANS